MNYSLGKEAYDAHALALNLDVPCFAQLTRDEQKAWCAAAQAVLAEMKRRAKANGPTATLPWC